MQGLRLAAMTAMVSALAACTGSGGTPTLAPLTSETAAQAPQPQSTLPPPQGVATAAAAAPLQTGPIATAARLQFAPVVGAAQEVLPPLSLRLAARAGQRGIPVVHQGGGATHLLRGYFSTFTEGRDTTIIYVWDVVDAAGNRLHRIQGQQTAPGGGAQGWAAVTPQAMEAIADRTIDEMAAWLSANRV
jgi:hypothetical protein